MSTNGRLDDQQDLMYIYVIPGLSASPCQLWNKRAGIIRTIIRTLSRRILGSAGTRHLLIRESLLLNVHSVCNPVICAYKSQAFCEFVTPPSCDDRELVNSDFCAFEPKCG